MQHYTTLAEISRHDPCSGQKKDGSLYGIIKLEAFLGPEYGKETPITYTQVLESNGLDDAVWAIRADLSPNMECAARRFACDCAEYVLHFFEEQYPEDKRPRLTIVTARSFANSRASRTELDAARVAAWTAWDAAARDAASNNWTPAWDAAWAGACAAWEAASTPGNSARAAWAASRAVAHAWVADWAAAHEWQTAKFKEYFCN